jgi:hypothetical protein
MDLSHPSTLLVPAGVVVLIGWRVYSRLKRMVGRQRLSRVRPWLTVGLLPLLVALLLLRSLTHPSAALALAAGLAAGVALARYGWARTRLENTPLGLFYTPNAHVGIALSLLLVARLLYRAGQLYFFSVETQASSIAFLQSPVTLLIFGTLAGYYVAYAVCLLRWRRRVDSGSALPVADPHGV